MASPEPGRRCTVKLSSDALGRARRFLAESARPLDLALFRLGFEGGSREAVLEALAPFRNEDGGFGHGLEPDLRMPGSSVLATSHALVVLREAGTPGTHPFVGDAVGWLVAAYDADLGAWRSVPREAEEHPCAGHWAWSLHESGTRWPVAVLPRAEILSHLHHYAEDVPADWLAELSERFTADLAGVAPAVGTDAAIGCELLAHTAAAPEALRHATAECLRRIVPGMVNRDPEAWSGYVPKPVRLVPRPDCVVADELGEDVARNLDWEIEHQGADGSWSPSWSWQDHPEAWAVARREWQGHLTREILLALRAWGRMEGAPPA